MVFGREKHEMGHKGDWMMMKWMMEMMTEDEMKMMVAKKMDMKIMMLEQKLEYNKWLRDWLKGKM